MLHKLFAVLSAAIVCLPSFSQVKVHPEQTAGIVKPVNGVGQPPMVSPKDLSMFKYLKDAGIPYSRLHDVGGGYGGFVYVDIPNVFRNFDADENDPASYDFSFTDILMKGLVDNGVEPYYRLGVTIENYASIKSYRIDPPKDYAKWARICEHIILHYNEGWADGFHMNVSHWEIWNEPENGDTVKTNQMWTGTWEDYMNLYGITATYLKGRFPNLKIGGYGSCGFYAITGEGVKAANASPRNQYFVDCFLAFLERARKEHWPLDFFSAHSYDKPSRAVYQMQYARKKLDEYGFTKTELSVNEWLPQPSMEKLNTARQAAEIAAEMIGFQNTAVDNAEIYDARSRRGTYAPLFQQDPNKPLKAYYSFVMFNELRKLGTAVRVECDETELYVTAATDRKGKAAVLVSNISGQEWKCNFDFDGYSVKQVYILDETRQNELLKKAPKKIANNTVCLYLLEK